jgi:AraC-like DNA-binding protein
MPLHYEEHAPPDGVADRVACVWTLSGTAPAPAAFELILPDGRPELVVHRGDAFRQRLSSGATRVQPRRMVVGQMTAGVAIAPGRRVATIGVRFTPAGLAPLCPGPQHALAGAIVDVGRLEAPRLRAIAAAAAGAPTLAAAVTLVRAALGRAYDGAAPVDARIARAVARITATGGIASMADVAGAGATSPRWLERHFPAVVGVSPKRFARLVRFRRALAALEPGARGGGVALALEHGFYDQAHFIAEFRAFAGDAPRRFVEQRLTALTRHFVDRSAAHRAVSGISKTAGTARRDTARTEGR